ncbi:MAG: hypothetical protein ACO24D_18750, partial [bacterium]
NLVSESGSQLSEAFVLSFTTGSSLFSAETFLRHQGNFTDNYTNSPSITLLLSSANENSLSYQLTDQSVAPSSAGSGWQIPLGYPVEVPFTLSELSAGSKTVTAWFDDGEQLVDNFSLSLVYDPEPPTAALEFAQRVTREAEIEMMLRAEDTLSPIIGYLLKLDNLTPALDAEDWGRLETSNREAELPLSWLVDNSAERVFTLYGWVIDGAGNLSEVFSDQLQVDLTPPTAELLTTLPEFLQEQELSVELQVEDNFEGELFYLLSENDQRPELDSSNWQAYLGENLNYSVSDTADGLFSLSLWIRDEAGNLAGPSILTTLIDRTPPSINSFTINNGDNFTNSSEIILSWQASDNGSGIKDFYLSETNTEPTSEEEWITYPDTTENYPYSFIDEQDGLKSLTLYLRDFAGNIQSIQDNISLDTQGPEVSFQELPAFLNSDNYSLPLSLDGETGEEIY